MLVAVDRLSGGPGFSGEDERLLQAFASAAAPAVATAQDVGGLLLRRSMQASERERGRWARELHDQTLQDLASLKVLLSGARRTTERPGLDRALDQALEQVQIGIDELRGLITELRPASLDELGTEPALAALTARIVATTGLQVDLTVDLAYEAGRAATRHPPELESTLYRLVQEALTNAVKHADASRVVIAVEENDQAVHVSVRDDGIGFEPDDASEGFGLLGMRERVALAGGTLQVTSRPGDGTAVTSEIPVRRRAAGEARPGRTATEPAA